MLAGRAGPGRAAHTALSSQRQCTQTAPRSRGASGDPAWRRVAEHASQKAWRLQPRDRGRQDRYAFLRPLTARYTTGVPWRAVARGGEGRGGAHTAQQRPARAAGRPLPIGPHKQSRRAIRRWPSTREPIALRRGAWPARSEVCGQISGQTAVPGSAPRAASGATWRRPATRRTPACAQRATVTAAGRQATGGGGGGHPRQTNPGRQ
jgi:hypothetical protein